MPLPDYLQVCRLCVLKHASFANIFDVSGVLNIRVADVINELLELNVYPGDGLPEKVCCDCLNELARFKRFKSVSHEAKATLECVIKKNDIPLPKPSSSSLNEESNIVEIVDLAENDDDVEDEEDSGAETVAAPSPLSHVSGSSQSESDMDIGETREYSDCNTVCVPSVKARSDSNKPSLSSFCMNTQPSSSSSVYFPKAEDLEGKGDDKRMSLTKVGNSSLEIDPESDIESVIDVESESDIVELEDEAPFPEAPRREDHCSRTFGFVRVSKGTSVNAAKSGQNVQVDKDVEELLTNEDQKGSSNGASSVMKPHQCS